MDEGKIALFLIFWYIIVHDFQEVYENSIGLCLFSWQSLDIIILDEHTMFLLLSPKHE